MPCDTRVLDGQTLEQRGKEIDETLKRLELQLGAGTASLRVGPQGALVIGGWQDRRGVTDVCAFRMLKLKGGWEFRKALAKAEQTAGRKVNEQAIGAGIHSHDGGKTWGGH
jgi:hypothetical protein